MTIAFQLAVFALSITSLIFLAFIIAAGTQHKEGLRFVLSRSALISLLHFHF
jgi:hypothetical protein